MLALAYLRPEEDQSSWSKRRQGFQPCCEAGIREPTLSGLHPVLLLALATYSRVVLTANLWLQVGLCNGMVLLALF